MCKYTRVDSPHGLSELAVGQFVHWLTNMNMIYMRSDGAAVALVGQTFLTAVFAWIYRVALVHGNVDYIEDIKPARAARKKMKRAAKKVRMANCILAASITLYLHQ